MSREKPKKSETLTMGLERTGKIFQKYKNKPKKYKPDWCEEIGDIIEKYYPNNINRKGSS